MTSFGYDDSPSYDCKWNSEVRNDLRPSLELAREYLIANPSAAEVQVLKPEISSTDVKQVQAGNTKPEHGHKPIFAKTLRCQYLPG